MALAALAVVGLLCIAYRYRAEHYGIVHEVFLTDAEARTLVLHGAVCYSNRELSDAVTSTTLLSRAGMDAFDLDERHLIACIIPNYTIEKVVGRDDFGLIILKRSTTPGVTFAVVRGTKRLLQFNYPKSANQ